tara:strand:+ start:48 stop:707 length:660 start_codon:yes stop_codon:yes gene_type:complete
MSARDHILGAVRRSLGRDGPLPDSETRPLDARLANPVSHIKPALEEAAVRQFETKLTSAGASMVRVTSKAQVVEAVMDYLKANQLPAEVVTSADQDIAELSWPELLEVGRRSTGGDDLVSVTGAAIAIAEAGTLVLTSSLQHPTPLNFLPDHHLVVLPASKIANHLEDAWALLREDSSQWPRTVNLVSGPSKTADVEQTIQLGAHGPRRLHVIVYEQPD